MIYIIRQSKQVYNEKIAKLSMSFKYKKIHIKTYYFGKRYLEAYECMIKFELFEKAGVLLIEITKLVCY